jgi:glycosyltransferase involved in cell wall biosynthesis
VPLFTIMLPIVRPPALLPFAVESVLSQTLADWELHIICDGAPDATVAVAEGYAARDPRIKVRRFAKGERNGEHYRHLVLQEARSAYVAQIGDDDIWFPDHLRELELLLREEVDFGHLLQCEIQPNGSALFIVGDLALEATQARMLSEEWSCFGPTAAGYRLETYRRLPVGWSPAPPELPSDVFMWRKFLTLPGIRLGTRFTIQSVKMGAVKRPEVSLEQRREENARIASMIASYECRSDLAAAAWRCTWHNGLAGLLAI